MRNQSASPWWRSAVIYQVYPRSFQDSNGDGVGDLTGIIGRVDYLQWLGVDAIWLSPIFPSPMADFGYDVADYTGVDRLLGSLTDLDELVETLHRRGMRLLLDFVPNHTSDQHPWFLDARSSRSADRRDWYIWRDPAPSGGPPNDWQSVFGGSAWELDQATGQYYFHSFLKEQPDLDWRNPAVRAAMADVLRFWFRRGVDGFRIDVVWLLAKGPELLPHSERRSTPQPPDYSTDQPAIHQHTRFLRGVADEFDDRLLIGEIYLPVERLIAYYGEAGSGLHLPFNFQLLRLPWRPVEIHRAIVRYEELLPAGAWPNWVLGNHDNGRILTRVGAAQARVAAMLLLTLRGTPTIYYGDEIGMADVDVAPAEQRDPQGLRGGVSRDPARTPMRWRGTPGAGFSDASPWLPVGPDIDTVNVETQQGQPDSMLGLHRRLLELRRAEPALSVGEWRDLGTAGSSLAYLRTHGARSLVVALNLAAERTPLPAAVQGVAGRIAVSTLGAGVGERFDGTRGLRADEGVVVLLD
ncbi:MAG: alpha-amylase family glycosyl hydrolase [Chloroflexota bacterium]|nr:alpha-amylase family glycosyl hydrolase [Chloroflexota bacterium]